MIFKLSIHLLIFFVNQLTSVYSQSDQSTTTSKQVYLTLTVLLFFLFTVFGILTAFLIKHKPRRRVLPTDKITKDVENSANSDDIAFLKNEKSHDVASFDFSSNKSILQFDKSKQTFDDHTEKKPDMIIKSKLLKDYLNQQSSDEFESKSSDSLNELNKEFKKSLGLEDSLTSIGAQSSPEFTEIPKGLIANAGKENDEQRSETRDADTISDTYTVSIDDRKSEQSEDQLDKENKSNDLLKSMLETKKSLTELLDKKGRKNPLHSSDDSINECAFCSDTYEGNKKKGEIEIEKMAKQNEIPETSTFPDSSDNESMKSTKSYHSYGFPLENENMPSDSLVQQTSTDLTFESSNSLRNSTQRWEKLYNLKLEKPSDYDQMMKKMNPPSNENVVNAEDKRSQEEKRETSVESSPKYELKTIVCSPLDSDDPNSKYLCRSPNEQIQSPEETDPVKLLESLNESENSEYSESDKSKQTNQQPKNEDQQVENFIEESTKQFSTMRTSNKPDETESLKTLNSVDACLDDYSTLKNASQINSNRSSNPKSTKLNKSVLDVLEKFENRM